MTTDLNGRSTWLVSVGTDFNLYFKKNDDGALSATKDGWTDWGGDVRYEPFVLHIVNNGLNVFTVNPATGSLRLKYTPNINSPVSASEGWYDLGGTLAGAPVACLWNATSGGSAAYCVGMNGYMYECSYYSGKWNWYQLSSASDRVPAFQADKIYASSDGKGRIDVVAVGVNNMLYHRYNAGQGWSVWSGVGHNTVASRPYCVTMSHERCDIVFKDATNFYLYHTAIENGFFMGFQQLAAEAIAFDFSGDKYNDKRFDIAAIINNKGELVHTWVIIEPGKLGTPRSGYERHGGVFSSSPKVSCRGSSIDLFGRGMDSCIYYKYWDGGKFNGLYNIGGALQTKPC